MFDLCNSDRFLHSFLVSSIPICYLCSPECYVSSGEVNINGPSVNELETFMWYSSATLL